MRRSVAFAVFLLALATHACGSDGSTGKPSAIASETLDADASSLVGTWLVRGIAVDDGQLEEGYGTATLTFNDDETMDGQTECNEVHGIYRLGPSGSTEIRFPPPELRSTAVGCANEAPITSALATVRQFAYDGSATELSFLTDDGRVVMKLAAAP